MNRDLFIKEITKLGVRYTDVMMHQIDVYKDFLLEYNKHTNLTAIRDEEGVFQKHFYDSLTLTKIVDLAKINNLIDIGTGAGFPGVIIKIFYPNIKVTLLDSNNKKINFLNELIQKIGLKDIECINARAEEYVKDNLNKYDLVVSRAVAYIDIISILSLPLARENGKIILMKMPSLEEENLLKKHYKELNIKSYEIIKISDDRCFYILDKNNVNKVLSYKDILKKHELLIKQK